jgi:hypothetical protein
MVTVRTTKFDIKQFCVLPVQCIYVFFMDLREKKQRLFPCTALTDGFLEPRRIVFTARYGLGI